ncbi:MAG: metal-sensitive transcriptional regulator [Ottowia sp.]|jgi:DNA-binding FrmR family transcriptional regulator|nr:metal-sensitive transcriptional regulator [Ottowia sp.]
MGTMTDELKKKSLCDRLARIEGQLRGLQKLIQAEAESEQVAQQMTAARKALDKAFFALVGALIAEGATGKDDIASLLVRFA